jgi:REP element-mobilizing transposase RayT
MAGVAGKMPALHKQWHSRGYLPHCDVPGLLQSISFRLGDALPVAAIARIQQARTDKEKYQRTETLLNQGYGACYLQQPLLAETVENALLYGDGGRYRLIAWCVMPNHVHVLIETFTGWPLPIVIHSWKSFTAKAINSHLGTSGMVWMEDYFDRYIRDDTHLAAVIAYIHNNPVKAGLVATPEEWPYSSASRSRNAGILPARL